MPVPIGPKEDNAIDNGDGTVTLPRTVYIANKDKIAHYAMALDAIALEQAAATDPERKRGQDALKALPASSVGLSGIK